MDEGGAGSHLRLHDCLDLRDSRLGAKRLLVRHLERDAFMVQRARVVRRVYRTPDLVPLALRALPLGFLLLEPCEDDRQHQRGRVLHRLQDLEPVDRFDNALVNSLARPTKVWLEAKDRTYLGDHPKNFALLRCDAALPHRRFSCAP